MNKLIITLFALFTLALGACSSPTPQRTEDPAVPPIIAPAAAMEPNTDTSTDLGAASSGRGI